MRSRRLDHVTFRVDDTFQAVGWNLAMELRDRCAVADDPHARQVAQKIVAVGASRPVSLDVDERAALALVVHAWLADSGDALALVELLRK